MSAAQTYRIAVAMTTSMRCSGAVAQSKVLKSNILLAVVRTGLAQCGVLPMSALVLGARRYRWVLSGTERANAQPLRVE